MQVAGRLTPRLKWQLFFTMQPLLIWGERAAAAAAAAAGLAQPPAALRVAAALCALLGTAHLLFFQPAEELGIAERFAAGMRAAFADPVRAMLAP